MKPDWKDAPEWANWLALDPSSGNWRWHEHEPYMTFVGKSASWKSSGRSVWQPHALTTEDIKEHRIYKS